MSDTVLLVGIDYDDAYKAVTVSGDDRYGARFGTGDPVADWASACRWVANFMVEHGEAHVMRKSSCNHFVVDVAGWRWDEHLMLVRDEEIPETKLVFDVHLNVSQGGWVFNRVTVVCQSNIADFRHGDARRFTGGNPKTAWNRAMDWMHGRSMGSVVVWRTITDEAADYMTENDLRFDEEGRMVDDPSRAIADWLEEAGELIESAPSELFATVDPESGATVIGRKRDDGTRPMMGDGRVLPAFVLARWNLGNG